MKQIISFLVIVLFASGSLMAQNDLGKLDDAGRIMISPYIPDQVENMPASASDLLANRLRIVITKNGLSADNGVARFLATAHVSVLSKDITATAPPMTALTLEVTFYIVDAYEQTIFSQTTTTLKGAGTNETKAYINAIKNIRPNDGRLKKWIEKGKEGILEYYNTQCDFILSQSDALVAMQGYEEAMFLLSSVPLVNMECYLKCMDKLGDVYALSIGEDPILNDSIVSDSIIAAPIEVLNEDDVFTVSHVSSTTTTDVAPPAGEAVLIGDDFYITYTAAATVGEYTSVLFSLENRGANEALYKNRASTFSRSYAITGDGEQKDLYKFFLGNKEGASEILVVPGTPVKIKMMFPKFSSMVMLTYFYNDNKFNINHPSALASKHAVPSPEKEKYIEEGQGKGKSYSNKLSSDVSNWLE